MYSRIFPLLFLYLQCVCILTCISYAEAEVKLITTKLGLIGSSLKETAWEFNVGDFQVGVKHEPPSFNHDIPWAVEIVRTDNVKVIPVPPVTTTTPEPELTTFIPVIPDNDNYEAIGNNQYRLVKQGKAKWNAASNRCQKDGGHLAVITSKKEANLIKKFLVSKGVDSVFIGVSDQKKEGRFVTVLGTRLENTGFVNWAEGEPDNGGQNAYYGEDCVVFTSEGTLRDVRCDKRREYLCQKAK